MRTKEEILMNVFKQNCTERIFRFQKVVNHDLTLKAMQEYAEEYHRSELLKLNKSDVSVTVCKCKKPILIATVHPLPDICDYCRKQIIQTEH